MTEIEIPNPIKMYHLKHEIIPDTFYIYDFGCVLFHRHDYFNTWCMNYARFVENKLESKRKKYTKEKWDYIRKFFDRETAFKEYCITNKNWEKEIRREKEKLYRDKNAEKIRQTRKAYYQNNKEKIEQNKEKYREKNYDKIIEQQRKHLEEKQVTCPCGGRYMDVESKKKRHEKTSLHQKHISNINN